MFFSQEDDDQDFLSPTGGSKLASLFGMDQASSQGGNESLTYTAPKEPKKKKPGEATSKESAGPSVIHAVPAHCFKYLDGKYVNQGKLGVAILGNHSQQDYKILLYVNKQKQITNAQISTSFSLTVLPNRYISFYDDIRQGWSVMFDTEAQVTAFAKEIAIAKANSSGSALDSLVSQDLSLGEGGPLESGDSAEIRYTGWLLQNNTIGQEFDSNVGADKLFRFKLGKGKVIKGWEEGVLGMKKQSKRLLIVPPSLGYGTSGMPGKVPPSATLVFEVEVVRVKLAKVSQAETSSIASEPEPVSAVTSEIPSDATSEPVSDTDGESVKARSRSISEQLSHGPGSQSDSTISAEDSSTTESATSAKNDKAKLISRMAKMGKPMLPRTNSGQGDVDGSEEEDKDTEEATPPHQDAHVKPSLPPKPSPSPGATSAATLPQQAIPTVAAGYPQVTPHPLGVADVAPQMAPPAATSAVFQGVQMPSQVAVYQSHMNQPFHTMYPQPQYSYPNQYTGQHPTAGHIPGQTIPPPPAPQPATSDIHTPVLLSEARQQNTEVRLCLNKLQDKVDKVAEKVDQIHSSSAGQGMALGMPVSMPTMDAGLLLHSIQRIVQENERLKKEIFEKNARVESQNEKISELIQRNQRYVEQSNSMLEQRNDSYKTTAAQSQTRLLALEEERVKLVTDLAEEKSQVGTLQLEMANIRLREVELRQQLESLVGSSQLHRDELAALRIEKTDLEGRLEQVTSSLKEERQTRKQLEGQVSSLQEDLSDVRATAESLEKNLAERKRKSAAEKKQLEEEIDDLKSQHEEEISSLKDRLRKQKSSIDATASEQVAELEEQLHREWKQKCDRLLSSAHEKHQRAVAEHQDEKEQLEDKIREMEKKVDSAKAAKGDTNKQVETLQQEVDSLKAWKEKYENLRTQAAAMKDLYEQRISELEAASQGGDTITRDTLVTEVKKIMNFVYHELKGEFAADKTYKGSAIHDVVLNTVKTTTMRMVEAQEEEERAPPVQEKMEVSDVGGQLSAPLPKAGSAKDDKKDSTKDSMKAAGGGSSLSALEASIITGDVLPSSGTTEPEKSGASDPKKPKTVPVVAPITGDKGNPYYAEELRKAAEEAKQEKAKEKKIDPVVAPVTGDKGNPYYAEELRKAGEEAKAAKAAQDKSTSKDAVEKPVSMGMTSAAPPKPVKEDKDQKVVAPICGDKGNPYYAEELRQAAEKVKEKIADAGATGSTKQTDSAVSPVDAPVTGDKGNPYYAAELLGKKLEHIKYPQPERSEAEVLAGIQAAMAAFAEEGTGDQAKKAKDSDNKTQKEKKEDKKGEVSTAAEKKPDKSLEKTDDKKIDDKKKVDDKKKEAEDKKKADEKKKAEEKQKVDKKPATKSEPAKKDTKASGSESEDEFRKPPPPPLFGDDEDDDSDWLS